MTMNDDRRFDPTEDDRVMTDADRTTDDRLGERTTDDRLDDRMTSDRTSDALGDRTSDPLGDRTGDALGDRVDDVRDDRTTTTDPANGQASEEPLVAPDAVVDFRARWEVIQQGFVDDPRKAVTEADNLVDDLLKRLSDTFERQHQDLEKQWSDGEPSTEDLRSALQRYRAFFQRLLTL